MPSAYGRRRRCSVWRTVLLSPYSASATTAVSVMPGRARLPDAASGRVAISPESRPPSESAPSARRAASVVHASGRYSAAPIGHARWPVQSAAVTATWQFATLPSAPQYCRATPTECGPDLGKLVSSRIRMPVRSGVTRPQPPPDHLGLPRRMRDEVLKGLIRRRLADPLEHRRHRLARAVAQQAIDILPQRHVLRAMAEAVLELIQPPRQSSQQRPRVPIEHWAAAYRTRENCTMSSIVITRGFPRESDEVTKSYRLREQPDLPLADLRRARPRVQRAVVLERSSAPAAATTGTSTARP